jgi:hypothetical protein
MLRHGSHVVCAVLRTLVVEDNASRMLRIVRCPLLAALELRRCRVSAVAFRMCSCPLACRLLSDARCLWHAARCPLSAAGPHVALLSLALLSVSVAPRLLSFPRGLWSAACYTLHAALRVARRCCSLHIARCMTHVVGMSCVAQGVLSVAFPPVHVACVCCTWSVFCCLPPCPQSHGVRYLSPVSRRISSRCMCCEASRRLHVA